MTRIPARRKDDVANQPPRKPTRPAKKPWQRPTLKSGRLFEANSLACGKNGPGMDMCEQFPKQS
jgi:hypothetical protein